MVSQVLAVSQGPVSHLPFPSSPPGSRQHCACSPSQLQIAPGQVELWRDFRLRRVSGEGHQPAAWQGFADLSSSLSFGLPWQSCNWGRQEYILLPSVDVGICIVEKRCWEG